MPSCKPGPIRISPTAISRRFIRTMGSFLHRWSSIRRPATRDRSDDRLCHCKHALLQSGRAQVFAWYDYIKGEMPDAFFNQSSTNSDYPLNFAANPYSGGTNLSTYGQYVLPIGHAVQGPFATNATWSGYGDSHFDPNTGAFISTNFGLGLVGRGSSGPLTPPRPGSTRIWDTCPGL